MKRRRNPREGGGPVSLCVYCIHKITFTSTCAAYPSGIPGDFNSGFAAHLTATGDDNGITFEAHNEYGMTREKALSLAGPDAYKAFLKAMDARTDEVTLEEGQEDS